MATAQYLQGFCYRSKSGWNVKARRRLPITTMRMDENSQLMSNYQPKPRSRQQQLYPGVDVRRIRQSLNRELNRSWEYRRMLVLIREEQHIMDYINVATAAKKIGLLIDAAQGSFKVSQQQAILELFNTLLPLMDNTLDSMDSFAIQNCMWSLGKAVEAIDVDTNNEVFRQVYGRLCSRAVAMGPALRCQGVVNCLWSMGKLQWGNQQQVEALVRAVTFINEREFRHQQIANIIWSLANLRYNNQRVISVFVDLAKENIRSMGAQSISNLLWGLSRLRYYDKGIIKLAEVVIISRPVKFSSLGVANSLPAFVDFGIDQQKEILNLLIEQFLNVRSKSASEYSRVLQYLAMLECPVQQVQPIVKQLDSDFRQYNRRYRDSQFCEVRRAQLEYISRGQQLKLPPQLQAKCIGKQKSRTKWSIQTSNEFQDEVFRYLREKFPSVRQRVLVQNGELEVSIELIHEQNQIAILPRLPDCYATNDQKYLMGQAKAYNKLLQNFGWIVIDVSQLEWDQEKYKQAIVKQIQQACNQQ